MQELHLNTTLHAGESYTDMSRSWEDIRSAVQAISAAISPAISPQLLGGHPLRRAGHLRRDLPRELKRSPRSSWETIRSALQGDGAAGVGVVGATVRVEEAVRRMHAF